MVRQKNYSFMQKSSPWGLSVFVFFCTFLISSFTILNFFHQKLCKIGCLADRNYRMNCSCKNQFWKCELFTRSLPCLRYICFSGCFLLFVKLLKVFVWFLHSSMLPFKTSPGRTCRPFVGKKNFNYSRSTPR